MKPQLILITFVGITLLTIGCAPVLPTQIDRVESMTVIDFREYSLKGFLFTPEGFPGKYESVGLIDFWVAEGAKWKVEETKIGRYAGGDLVDRYASWEYEGTDIQKLVDLIYQRCDEMGANALINFRITRGVETKGHSSRPAVVRTYHVQGLAIIRS